MQKPAFFSGCYFKHQKEDITIAFITGTASSGRFLQVITNNGSHPIAQSAHNRFSRKGIQIQIEQPDITMHGCIRYGALTPIRYDIMGPFKYFPMECRHEVISMHHKLSGVLNINGKAVDFTGGTGYLEKDSGISFPKSYLWLQSNDFPEKASVMISIADIPFCGISFQGCICVIWYQGKEYRLATYLGVSVIACNKNQVILSQRNLLLIADLIPSPIAHPLSAPIIGNMSRTIRESLSCKARFRLFQNKRLVFDLESKNCGFEFVN